MRILTLVILIQAALGSLQNVSAQALVPQPMSGLALTVKRLHPETGTAIYVLPTGATQAVNISQRRNMDEYPAWSPDGVWIAFSSDGNLNIMDNQGGNVTRVTALGSDRSPSWHPTAPLLVFSTGEDGRAIAQAKDIAVIGTNGTGRTNLTNTRNLDERDPAWSPDGTRIVFSSGDLTKIGEHGNRPSDVFVMSASGTGRVNITRDMPSSYYCQPRWSPDGVWIICKAGSGGTGQKNLCLLAADGSQGRFLSHEDATFGIDRPCWSPAGNRLAFLRRFEGTPGPPRVYARNVDGAQITPLTDPALHVLDFDWSPVGPDAPFDFTPPDLKQRILLTMVGAYGDREIATLLPDGSGAMNLTRSDVAVAGGGSGEFLGAMASAHEIMAHWPPNHSKVAYVANTAVVFGLKDPFASGIWLMGSTGEAKAPSIAVIPSVEFVHSNPTFSPDGGRIACIRSGARKQGNYDWSGDRRSGGGDIVIFTPGGAAPSVITNVGALPSRPAWMAGGGSVIITKWTKLGIHLHTLDVITPGSLPVPFATGRDEYYQPEVSPDGSKVVCVGLAKDRSSYVLVIIDIATGEEVELPATANKDPREPTWSPDGRHIALIARGGVPMLHMINSDGTGLAAVSLPQGSRLRVPHYTPTWHGGPRSDAHSPNRLDRNIAASTTVAGFAVIINPPQITGKARLVLYKPDGSEDKELETPGLSSAWNLTWTADGGMLTFDGGPPENHDIFGIDVASGSPHALMNHPRYDTDQSFSPDGKWMAFCSNRDAQAPVLHLKEMRGGRLIRRQGAVAGDIDGRISWAPDSSFVVMSGLAASVPAQAVKVLLDGTSSRLTNLQFGCRHPQVSPDGKHIAFLRESVAQSWLHPEAPLDLCVMDTNGGDLRAITSGRALQEFGWDPSGKGFWVVEKSSQWSVHRIGLNGSSAETVFSSDAMRIEMRISPDDKSLLVAEQLQGEKGSRLWLVKDGKKKQILKVPGNLGIAWQPAAKH